MSVFLSSLTATILTALSSSSKLSFTFVNSTQTQRPHYRVKFENEALFLRPISRATVYRPHEDGAFLKRSSIRNNLKTTVCRVYEKHFEN